ncbi:ABC transporter ATP-binding protein [Nannocystaceae bacterium ST9]
MTPPANQSTGPGWIASLRTIVRFLVRYARRWWFAYLVGFAMLLATNWAVVRIPTLLGEVLDVLAEGGSSAKHEALSLSLAMIAWACALVVVRTLSRVLFFNPGREIEYRIGLDLFRHLLTLQRPFYARRKIGELASIAGNDLQSIRLLVGFAGLQVCNVAVAIPMHLWQMLRTDWVLTIWCAIPVVLGAAHMRWTVSRFYTMVRSSMEKLSSLSERILESYSGVGTVRAHVAEQAAVDRFARYNQDYLALQLRISSLRAFSMPVLSLAGFLGAALVLWIGGNRVLAGEIEVGALAVFTTLLMSLVGLLTSLAWVLTAFSRGVVSIDRVNAVLDTTPELPEVAASHALRRPPRLELRGLGFVHPGRDEPALEGVSVVVEPGHTLGIFGRTGSGKTTLIDLLARVHTPPAGQILIDGHDARTLELAPLREGMAVVPQTPFLFSTSLRDNVRLMGERTGHLLTEDAQQAASGIWGRRKRARDRASASVANLKLDQPDPQLDQVIEAACLGPDLSALPQGLDTVVGERGVMLSGGQRQRTALARALYRRPKLLLLDDVLSAVDQATETKLVAAIRGLAHEHEGGELPPTTVIVSHRTSVLEHADEILVLERGRVIERGTHAELLALAGSYAAAHEHQREQAQGEQVANTEARHG